MPSIVAERLHGVLSAENLRTGHWFHHLLVACLRAYAAKHPPDRLRVAKNPAAKSERIVRRAARRTALFGTGTAGIVTSAELLTAETAGLLALPLVANTMFGNLILAKRASITIEMSCDIAAAFGVRFDPNQPSELARLYAVALEAVSQPEHTQDRDKRGHAQIERIVRMHSEEVSSSIGSMLGNESLARKAVPVLNLFISGSTSYRVTRHLGEASQRYARGRRALGDAFAELQKVAPEVVEALIAGVWYVFTSDGVLDPEQAALLSHLVNSRPSGSRDALVRRLREDEGEWLRQLETVPRPARAAFMRALETAAALDTRVTPAERELLLAAGRHLGDASNTGHVDALAESFRKTGVVVHPTRCR